MTETLFNVALLLAVVGLVSGLARRLGLLRPILLLVVGVGFSYVPWVLNIELDPELVLEVMLPLLLYAATLEISVPAFKQNLRPIGWLALGHVIFIAVLVGFAVHAVVPQIPLAAAVALGAIVGPPDAVAATAVARRIGLPRQGVTILEGESLLNDATALTLLRVATAAVAGTAVGWIDGSLQFVVSAVGGALVGAIAGRLAALVHRLTDHPLMDNTISILTPFFAFLPAEFFHWNDYHLSGVVAVVVCGMYVSHRRPLLMGAASRLQMDAFWRVARFLLEGAVFLLVGLQVRGILASLKFSVWTVVVATLVVIGIVVVGRFAWVALGNVVPKLFGKQPVLPPRLAAVVSWAGMRGVVSLAAALGLAADFPGRDLIIWITFEVIVVTLVFQGLTLPWFVRVLKVPRDDPADDVLAEAQVRQAAFRAASMCLDKHVADDDQPRDVIDRLRTLSESRALRAWERLGDQARVPASEAFRSLRLDMLTYERQALLDARSDGVPEEVLRKIQNELDLEEMLLTRRARDEEVTVSGPGTGQCRHLADAVEDVTPRTPSGCEGCIADERTDWVHLRLCLDCGYVGCCDSSPQRHATQHFQAEGHPVIRSFEPGEVWRWCFVDEQLG
ncbi:Na+/H+ antiporter [Flindersiella endophytica]